MKLSGCRVIVCGPAIGKTYLAEHDQRFVDLDNERAKYKYGLYGKTLRELEEGKLNRGEIIHSDSSEYIINLLQKELADGKCVLLSYHEKILNYVKQNSIPYCLVFKGLECKDEIIERMRVRGNPEKFIEVYDDNQRWKEFYEINLNDKDATFKIELKKGEYLSDLVDKIFNE